MPEFIKGRKKILFIIFLATLLVIFLATDFYRIFLSPLEIGEEIEQKYGDAIVVLGGGLRPGVEIGFSTGERLNSAIKLYQQKKRIIILSDGSLYRTSPAIKKIRDFLVKHQVEEKDILFEGRSQTTFDNITFTKEIIKTHNFKEIIICTSPYHQRRAGMIMKFLKLRNFKIARMENSEVYKAASIKQRLRNIKLIFREYIAIIKFTLIKR